MAESEINDKLKERIRSFELDVTWLYDSLFDIGFQPMIDLKEGLTELKTTYSTKYEKVLFPRDSDMIEITKQIQRLSSEINDENNRLSRLKRKYNTLKYTDTLSKLEQSIIINDDISDENKSVISHFLQLKRKEANFHDGNVFLFAFQNVENSYKADYLMLTQNHLADNKITYDRTNQKRLEEQLPDFISAFPDEYKTKYVEILKVAKRNGYNYEMLYSLARTIPKHFISGKEELYLERILKSIDVKK